MGRTPESKYTTLTFADAESESNEMILGGGRLVQVIPVAGLVGPILRILVPESEGDTAFVPLVEDDTGNEVNIQFVVGKATAIGKAAPSLLTCGRFKLETMSDATTKAPQTGAQTIVVFTKGYTS